MFSALSQGASLYILQKGEDLKLSIGTVLSRTEPTNFHSQYTAFLPNQQEAPIEIEVSADGNTMKFSKVPANLSRADFGNTIITETREQMLSEVERMMAQSQSVIDSVPRHQRTLEQGKELLMQLNPVFAREQARERRIAHLEGDVGEMKAMLMAMQKT